MQRSARAVREAATLQSRSTIVGRWVSLRRRLSTSTDGGGGRVGGGSGDVHFDDGSGEKLAEVLDHALAKPQPSTSRSSSANEPNGILTTRREALSLYRSIWRATALFTWRTDAGGSSPPPSSPAGLGGGVELWRDALRRSARAEFEAARHERDPLMIARMLVVGRDAVAQAVERLAAKAQGCDGGRGGAPLR